MPESKSTLEEPPALSPSEASVKTKHMKSEERMELLNCFDWLPDNTHNKLLDTHHTFDKTIMFESSKPQKNLNNYISEMVTKLTEDKAHLFVMSLWKHNINRQLQRNTAAKFLLMN